MCLYLHHPKDYCWPSLYYHKIILWDHFYQPFPAPSQCLVVPGEPLTLSHPNSGSVFLFPHPYHWFFHLQLEKNMAIKNCRFANVNIFQQNNHLYNAMIHALVRFGKDVLKPLLESLGAIPVIWTSSSPIFCISRSWSQAKHAFLMTTAYLGLLICDVWGCISSIINRLCHKTIPNNKYMWLSEIKKENTECP